MIKTKTSAASRVDRPTKRARASRKIGTTAPGLRRIKPQHSAAAVTEYLPTPWPALGDDRQGPLPDDAFTAKAFTSRFEPGFKAYVYAAGCGQNFRNPAQAGGLLGVARDLKLPLYKISATQGDLRDRLDEVSTDRYASETNGADGPVCQVGFDAYTAQVLRPDRRPLDGSPVVVQTRCLEVHLPASLSLRVFEKELHAAMSRSSLNRWLDSPDGRRHCDMLGLVAADQKRFTTYAFGAGHRRSEAQEIYIARPRGRDAGRLIAIVERIVHDAVMPGERRMRHGWRCRSQR
ncbi:hypothetical protein SAMN05428997_10498 [Bosea sp. CRIB-10]|uniref:hypothetical protein n=1 Tax=Bosea sp. CRIB-10 TaxID=378404 RepID=UPI0008E16E77|nr:hypothetical protein [Bosea sp. CRIB-10]SFC10945.1 hypothetical protein SAMN05428997_10498 [Bosea sp. CRIB-10]